MGLGVAAVALLAEHEGIHEVAGLGEAPGEEGGDAGAAELVALGVEAFDEAIGEEGDPLAFIEGGLEGLDAKLRDDAEGRGAGHGELMDGALGIGAEWGAVAGVHQLQAALVHGGAAEESGDEHSPHSMAAEHGIPPRESGAWVDSGLDEKPEHGERLRHEEGGRDAFAGDIADDEVDLVRPSFDDVVEIAAHIQGRAVGRGDVKIRPGRERLRKEADLDFLGPGGFLRDAELLTLALDGAELIDGGGGEGAVGGEGLEVDLIERGPLERIDELDDADFFHPADEGNADDGASAEAGLQIELAEEAIIEVGIRNEQGDAVLGDPAGDAAAARDNDDTAAVELGRAAAGRGEGELAFSADEEEGSGLGTEDPAGDVEHRGEEGGIFGDAIDECAHLHQPFVEEELAFQGGDFHRHAGESVPGTLSRRKNFGKGGAWARKALVTSGPSGVKRGYEARFPVPPPPKPPDVRRPEFSGRGLAGYGGP